MQFAAKKWAQRTRALAKQGKTWDPAAMTAATEVFPAEFNVLILVSASSFYVVALPQP